MSLQNRIEKTAQKIDALSNKLKSLETGVKTEAYEILEEKLKSARYELEAFSEEQKKLSAQGLGSGMDKQYLAAWQNVKKIKQELEQTVKAKNPDSYMVIEDSLNRAKVKIEQLMSKNPRPLGDIKYYYEIESKLSGAQSKVSAIKNQIKEMENSGKAFLDGKDSEEYKKIATDLRNANHEMDTLKVKEQEVIDKQMKLNSKANELSDIARKSQEGIEKFGKSAAKASQSVKKLGKSSSTANKGFSNLARTMKQMVLSMAIFQIMFKGMEFLKSGLQNLAVYSKEYNKSMSELTSSTSQLKNAFAVAFQPILNIVIPILSQLISWISSAANAVSRFFSIIGGKSTYTKAIKQNKDYADSLDKVSSSSDEAKGSLAGYNELNVISSQKSSGGGGSSDAADGSGFVEESVGDTAKFDEIKKSLDEIVKIFKTGFQTGLRDWQSRLANIQKSTDSIRKSLKNIFTDPAVISGASTFGKSLIYNLGVVTGSAASVGLTIAQNLIGGISKYLEQNTGRIKQYIIKMFDIGTDISNLIGSFAESFAYVFEAFGSESGQKMTANLIQMFMDIRGSISLIIAEMGDDLLHLFLDPFINNKEGFKEALQGFLDVAEPIVETFSNIVRQCTDGLLTLYEQHVHPFIQNLTAGISEIVGALLEFWNTHMKPILEDWGKLFEETYQNHLKPVIDTCLSRFGKVIDILNLLWKNTLQPLIIWIIKNILPVIAPIIQAIGKTVHGMVNSIIDWVGTLSKGIDDALSVIIDLLNGDFAKAWVDVKTLVKNIVNGLLSVVESLANGVVDAVNTMINALNGISFTAPDWVPIIGGETMNLGIPNVPKVSIPRLANGGVTTGSTLANIGEAGREAVIPLERDTGWADIVADKLASKMPAGSIIQIEGDPNGMFRIVRKEANRYYRTTGNPAFDF